MNKDKDLIKKLDESLRTKENLNDCACDIKTHECKCKHGDDVVEEHITTSDSEFYRKETPGSICIKSYRHYGDGKPQRIISKDKLLDIYCKYVEIEKLHPMVPMQDAYAVYMSQFPEEQWPKDVELRPKGELSLHGLNLKLAVEELNSIVNSYFESEERAKCSVNDKRIANIMARKEKIKFRNIDTDKELGTNSTDEALSFDCPYDTTVGHCNGRELVMTGELPLKGIDILCKQCNHFNKENSAELTSEEFETVGQLVTSPKKETEPENESEHVTTEDLMKGDASKAFIETFSQQRLDSIKNNAVLNGIKRAKKLIEGEEHKPLEPVEAVECEKTFMKNNKKVVEKLMANKRGDVIQPHDVEREAVYVSREEPIDEAAIPDKAIEKRYGTCGIVKIKHPVKMVFDDCFELQQKKDHDYTYNGVSGFDKSWEKMGLKALWLRLNDKFSRFESFVFSEDEMAVKEEKIEDTLTDMINYAAMGLAKLKGYDKL